jgi:hypothetical protein
MRITHRIVTFCICAAIVVGVGAAAAPGDSGDGVASIAALFAEYDVVALDDGDHGNVNAHEFRLRLIRDPRFRAAVDDIVIEFGNAKYQDIADRYVNGDVVPDADLRRVWRDTSQASPVWDSSIYEEFFRAVRDMNLASPGGRRLRVLLGDPPIDWADVHGFADLTRQMRVIGDRDTHPARLIEREVRAPGRRALIVYGGVHLQRTPAAVKRPCDPAAPLCYPGSIVDQLASAGIPVFNVHTLTAAAPDVAARLAAGSAPRLIDLRRDDFGVVPYRAFQPSIPAMLGPDGQPQPEPPIRGVPLRDVFDALLYIGPPQSMHSATITDATCADAEYVAMRKSRMAMLAPPGAPAPHLCGQ